MQLSPTLSASGSPSWSVGTMQACSQDPENVLSAKMQQCLPGQQEVGKDNPDSVSFEQLQEERSRLFHVQRENNELRNRLSQLQQQHRLLESRCLECEQVRQAQEIELTKQNVIIQQLRGRLAHLQSLADTVAQEVHTCSTVLDGPLNPYLSAVDNLKAHTEALGCGKHVVGAKDLCDSQDQLQAKQLQRPAAVGLGRLLQLQQQIEQAAPAAPAEAASTGGRLQPQAPTVGSKRSRLCSATGSAGDAVVAANMKHAASGGSSSSRQQISGEDEPLDEGVDEVEPNGVYSIKMQHSPSVSEQLQAAAGRNGAVAANADQMDVEGDEEKSQDDLEAAECLQALATSCAEVHDPAEDGMLRMPSSSLSYKGIGSMMAAAARAISGSQNSWPANSQSSAAPHGNTFDPVLMASALHSYLQGAVGGHAEGHEQFNMAPSGQQAMVPGQQRKGAATAYTKSPSQLKQLHHQHHVVTAGAPGIRRPDGLAWGAAPKGLSAAGMSAPVRARKQSWFQTEISEKIPVSVQQACIQDWAAQQCMQVVCAEMEGTFYVNSAGEYLIKLSSSGEVVTPNKFEELAGKKTARNWQQSIRLRGYTMNGEPNSALLKLGHFTRIVGLVQDR